MLIGGKVSHSNLYEPILHQNVMQCIFGGNLKKEEIVLVSVVEECNRKLFDCDKITFVAKDVSDGVLNVAISKEVDVLRKIYFSKYNHASYLAGLILNKFYKIVRQDIAFLQKTPSL